MRFIALKFSENCMQFFKSQISCEDQLTFHDRLVLSQLHRTKIQSDIDFYKGLKTYFVEISMIRNSVYILAVEQNSNKDFDLSNGKQTINDNGNRIRVHKMFRKQFQSIFMQIFAFKKDKMLTKDLNDEGEGQITELTAKTRMVCVMKSFRTFMRLFSLKFGKIVFDSSVL